MLDLGIIKYMEISPGFKNALIYDNYIGIQCFSSLIKEELPNINICSFANDKNINFENLNYNDEFLNFIYINSLNNYSFNLLDKGLVKNNIIISSEIPINLYFNRVSKFNIMAYINRNNMNSNTLKEILKSYRKGSIYMSDEQRDILLNIKLFKNKNSKYDSQSTSKNLLSEQEYSVMQHLLKGKSISEIAIELNIHNSTVSTYKKRVFTKFGVNNIIELQNINF
jgi:DNA-binding CsgD family transcriptional regulator